MGSRPGVSAPLSMFVGHLRGAWRLFPLQLDTQLLWNVDQHEPAMPSLGISTRLGSFHVFIESVGGHSNRCCFVATATLSPRRC